MPETNSAELVQLVSHEQVENAFWKALRMFVGRGKRHRAEEVAVAAGVHKRTLDCYRGYPIGHPDHRPLDQGQKFSIASVIGADLTTAWLRIIDQGAFDLPDVEPDPGSLAVDTARDSAEIVHLAIDGIQPDEHDACRTVGSRMMRRGAQLVAMGG